MTLSKGLMDLVKCHDPNIIGSLSDDAIKAVMSTIKEYTFDISALLDRVKDKGFTFIVEPLIIYNPIEKHLFLGIQKPEGCQVLKKLCFNPKFYQELLRKVNEAGYYSTAYVEKKSGHHMTTLFIGNDETRVKAIKNAHECVYEERGMKYEK